MRYAQLELEQPVPLPLNPRLQLIDALLESFALTQLLKGQEELNGVRQAGGEQCVCSNGVMVGDGELCLACYPN